MPTLNFVCSLWQVDPLKARQPQIAHMPVSEPTTFVTTSTTKRTVSCSNFPLPLDMSRGPMQTNFDSTGTMCVGSGVEMRTPTPRKKTGVVCFVFHRGVNIRFGKQLRLVYLTHQSNLATLLLLIRRSMAWLLLRAIHARLVAPILHKCLVSYSLFAVLHISQMSPYAPHLTRYAHRHRRSRPRRMRPSPVVHPACIR